MSMSSNRNESRTYSPIGYVTTDDLSRTKPNHNNTNRSRLSSRSGRSRGSRRSLRMAVNTDLRDNDYRNSPSNQPHDHHDKDDDYHHHHHRTPSLEDTFNSVYKAMKARHERINRLNTDESSGNVSDYSYSTTSSISSNNSSHHHHTNKSNSRRSRSTSEKSNNGPNSWGFTKERAKTAPKQYIVAPYNLPNLGKDKHVSCHKDEYAPPNHSPGANIQKARARFVNGEGRFLRNILMEKQTFR